MTKHFINLTNGIEWIESLDFYEFVRIQSTTIERKNWIKLFSDLDHNLLMNLALGNECIIYDCGTNRKLSKSIYTAVPLIKYCLDRYWYGIVPEKINRICRNGDVTNQDLLPYFETIYNNLFLYDSNNLKVFLKKKLKYYKNYLNSTEVRLIGISKSTIHDGNYVFYSNIVKNIDN